MNKSITILIDIESDADNDEIQNELRTELGTLFENIDFNVEDLFIHTVKVEELKD